MTFRATHIDTACVLFEGAGLRLLTDPAFDPKGGEYSFGFGTHSTKTAAPAVAADALPAIDAVLLSHDQHADNLDTAGRAVLERAGRVITTRAAARRIGKGAIGLAPWESTTVGSLTITATPARHGPPLSLPFVGPVIGFVLQEPGRDAIYISGDTTFFGGVAEVGRRFTIGTAFLHLGGVGFPLWGPLRFTMGGRAAAKAAAAIGAKSIVPIHYDGWTHFLESRDASERAFRDAGLADRVRWIAKGQAIEL